MVEQLILPLKLNIQTNFENYVAGSNTELIYRLKNLFSIEAEVLSPKFFYVWGNKNAGKSHLIYATYLLALNNNHQAFYVGLKNFTQFQPTLFEKLEQNQITCLDDIDEIAGNSLWEESLFHLYNRISEHNHVLLVSTSKPNDKILWTLADLKSRLNSGLSYQLKPLTDAEKIQALTIQAKARGMNIGKQVWDYIMANYSRDMQTLFNILQELERQSLIQKKRITIPFVKNSISLYAL